MAKLPHANSRRMYSWWWDSHISPKNSRWLQENLTDMDAKVKSMIKLIEEDADSFARRAEMYYKKRPELMKMVEEFYRAYRALAERYDQSTRALLQASRTMTDNFPNQVPSGLTEDELARFANENDQQATDDQYSRPRKGSFEDDGKVGRERIRKGLNFDEDGEKEDRIGKSAVKLEKEIQTLKEALAKVEAEKESSLAQHKQSLDKLSQQERDFLNAQEDSKKAKYEVENLKIALNELEVENGTTVAKYQTCLEKIKHMEGIISRAEKQVIELNERAQKGDDEAQILKQDLVTIESQNATFMDQCKHSLEKILALENNLRFSEEKAKQLNKRAEGAEIEVEILKKALVQLGVEKEANSVQYQQCLDTISTLEKKFSYAEEEVHMLNGKLESGITKLKGAEEKCILLESKLVLAEEEAKKLNERAEEAETEAKVLRKAFAELGVENEVNVVQYQQCLDNISILEKKISCAEEEVHMLNGELESGVAKLKGAEAKCTLLENKLVLAEEKAKKLNERAKEAELLKNMVSELGVEKEANAVRYQQSLDTISTLEKKISCAKEEVHMLYGEIESGVAKLKGVEEKCILLENNLVLAEEEAKKLNERAEEAETQVEIMKKALAKLDVEKKANDVQYQQCLDTISTLEKNISCAEEEVQKLNGEIESGVTKLKGAKEKCIFLEYNLVLAEVEAKKLNERAGEAETEAETMKKALAELGLEKKANDVQYQQCLDTISTLEKNLSHAEEEMHILNGEIEKEVSKLKGAGEKCILLEKNNQSLHSELQSLKLKIGAQREELAAKEHENGMLRTSVQDERFRFVEAETAFQTLQLLHAQTKDELKFLALELQNRSLIVSDLETHNQSLLNESVKFKEENERLNELNLASLLSIKNMHGDIISLMETNKRFEEEVELRVDQRNALQQDIYCLKEELNDLRVKYVALLDQVEAVGFNPECFQSAVKGLQDKNLNLKEIQEKEMREKMELLERIEKLEKVVDKNAFLEKSLSDLSRDLEGAREEIHALEKIFKSVSEEKSTLDLEKASIVTQLQVATGNLVKLSEKNTFMENSVSDALYEIERQKMRLKSFEDSCEILENEKLDLVNEKVALICQVEITRQILEDLEKKYRWLEEKHLVLEKEKESVLCEVVKLQSTMNESKQKEENQMVEIENLQGNILVMQKTSVTLKEDNSKLLDKKISLSKNVMDLQEKNNTLEGENLLIIAEAASLSNLSVIFKNIINEKSLEIEEFRSNTDKLQGVSVGLEDKISVMEGKLETAQLENVNLKKLLKKTKDNLSAITLVNGELNLENSKLSDEKISLVKDFVDLQERNNTLKEENLLILGETASLSNLSVIFKNIIDEKYLEIEELQSTVDKLQGLTVGFEDKIRLIDGKLGESQFENMKLKKLLKKTEENLSAITLVNGELNMENSKLVDDKISVVKDFIDLQEKNKTLDGENLLILGETASFCNLSVIFQNIIKEKSLTIEELQSTVDKLQGVTVGYVNKISVMEGKLGEAQLESTDLNKRLKKTEENLSAITLINCQPILEIGEKETEISEAKCKVADTENEKSVLQSLIEDLKEKIGEIQMFYDEANRELNNKGVLWEIEATKLTSELFTSSVIQFLLDEKYKELVGVLKTLEEETNSKDKGIEMHTKRINILEVENGEIRARFAEYSLAINSLKDCIFSLENRTSLLNKLQNGHRDKGKVGTENQNHVESHEGSIEGQKETNNLSDLQDLETIVKVVERTIIETNSKLEAATRQIQELGSEIASNNEKVKPVPVKFESGNRFLTKDTTFDEISESSSYGIGMKECINTHISDCDGNENFTKEKEIEFDSGITVEKELGLDKLAISKRFSLPNQELDKTKILERLNSDSEKLIKLQTTVQDLKRRVEIREKRIDGKSFGRESVGEQLVKAEVNIMQLSDVNGKLMKNVDNSDDVKSVIESEENRSLRRKFSEQARKVSERIGQLQLEVQKIQFTMLKFHSENATEKIKKKSKITETKRRTSLSNYIGLRTRKKRRLFCGCIHPPSTAD